MKWIRSWFWSSVRDGENWAQTLVRIAGNLFRIVVTGVAVLIGAIATQSAISEGQQRQRASEVANILVFARLDDGNQRGECSAPYPLRIGVRNNSSRTLMQMTVRLSARHRGESTNVLGYGQDEIRWDSIVPPHHELGLCYSEDRARPADRTLIYNAQPDAHSVQLRDTEDWMLRETRATPTGSR